MYNIIKIEYTHTGKKISEEIIKKVCSKDEAIRLMEVVFRSDSFTKYTYEKDTK